jgi:hypothetical protein
MPLNAKEHFAVSRETHGGRGDDSPQRSGPLLETQSRRSQIVDKHHFDEKRGFGDHAINLGRAREVWASSGDGSGRRDGLVCRDGRSAWAVIERRSVVSPPAARIWLSQQAPIAFTPMELEFVQW